MIIPGLVSVTFRKLAPAAIVDLARRAGVAAIEWGGDIHVPHGDLQKAEAVAAYGSYYRAGHSEGEGLAFESVLATAKALGAPLIRVWAGAQGSVQADDAYRESICKDARRAAELASAAGMAVAFEYHNNTLTDTAASARRLIEAIQHPAIRSYWQPISAADARANLEGLDSLLPWLSNLHVFHRDAATGKQLALQEGAEAWRRYLDRTTSTGRDHYALLEFVRDNSPDAFLEDARILKSWLAGCRA